MGKKRGGVWYEILEEGDENFKAQEKGGKRGVFQGGGGKRETKRVITCAPQTAKKKEKRKTC